MGLAAYAREYIAQVGEGIDMMPLASRDEASQHRRRSSTVVAAQERPIASAMELNP